MSIRRSGVTLVGAARRAPIEGGSGETTVDLHTTRVSAQATVVATALGVRWRLHRLRCPTSHVWHAVAFLDERLVEADGERAADVTTGE